MELNLSAIQDIEYFAAGFGGTDTERGHPAMV